MQLRAIKCIRNDFTISSEEAENYGNQLGLKLLEDRRKEQLLILMFKYNKLGKHVDHHRPEVVLRNNDAIKFLKRRHVFKCTNMLSVCIIYRTLLYCVFENMYL